MGGCSSRDVERQAAVSAKEASPDAGASVLTKQVVLKEKCEQNPFFKGIWVTVEAPMLVMSLSDFASAGRVPRSNDGMGRAFLDLPAEAAVVFVSHRWLRPSADPSTAHPDDVNNGKHGLLCKGIRSLAALKGWAVENTYLWMDFFSIEQDDVQAKMAGIASLRGYAAACDAMMIPCASLPKTTMRDVDMLPGSYGERAWTRLEAMTFFTISSLSGPGCQEIFAVADSEPLFIERYSYDIDIRFLPSEGVLFSEADRPVIKMHEERMMEFLSSGLKDAEMMCRFLLKNMLKGRGLEQQDSGMLWAAVRKAQEMQLDLGSSIEMDFRANTIGPEGAKAVAEVLKPQLGSDGRWTHGAAVQRLMMGRNAIGDEGAIGLAEALAPRDNADGSWSYNTELRKLDLRDNGIGSSGVKALAGIFTAKADPGGTWRSGTPLEELHLRINNIGDEGAVALAEILAPKQNPDGGWSQNTTLQTVDITFAGVGDDGARAIAKALEPRSDPDGGWSFNTALTHLIYEMNDDMSKEADQALEDSIAAVNKLRSGEPIKTHS